METLTQTNEAGMDSLQLMLGEAWEAQREAERIHREALWAAMEPVRDAERKIRELEYSIKTRVAEEFKARNEAAKQDVADVQARIDALRLAEKSAGAPYPEGTILYGWKSSRYGTNWIETEKSGYFEIWTAASVFEGPSWKRPMIGSYVVRTRLKNGGRGKSFAEYNSYSVKWLPEGVSPNQK